MFNDVANLWAFVSAPRDRARHGGKTGARIDLRPLFVRCSIICLDGTWRSGILIVAAHRREAAG
jgi:hypothetical protein